jgi:hypothetical protein
MSVILPSLLSGAIVDQRADELKLLVLWSQINLVAPADDAPVPPPEALAKVQRELIKRESAIQAKILALGPTFEFAKAEPAFAAPFKGEGGSRLLPSLRLLPHPAGEEGSLRDSF